MFGSSDKNFAIVFLVHIGFICISAMFAPTVVKNYASGLYSDYNQAAEYYEDSREYYDQVSAEFAAAAENAFAEIMSLVAFCIFCSAALSLVFTVGALCFLQKHAERVIKVSVIFTIVWFFGLGLLVLASTPTIDTNSGGYYYADNVDNMPIAIFFFVVAAIYVCYAFSFWKDIPFAASTITTGVTACRANLGVFSFAFVSPMLNFITVILQCMSILTLLSWVGIFDKIEDSSDTATFVAYLVTFFWLVSLYWTSEVIKVRAMKMPELYLNLTILIIIIYFHCRIFQQSL